MTRRPVCAALEQSASPSASRARARIRAVLAAALLWASAALPACAPSAPGPVENLPPGPGFYQDLGSLPQPGPADLGSGGTADLAPITGCQIPNQYGCPAGMKCTTHDAVTTICDPSGTTPRGEKCTRTAGVDSCVAGTACSDEGGGYSQCRQFCTGDGQCGTKSFCERALGTGGIKMCTEPCTALYPGAGCRGGLGCYAYEDQHTDCRSPGAAGEGQPCYYPQDCQPGMACLGPALGATYCRRVCLRASGSGCRTGQICADVNFNGRPWPDYGACF